MSNYFFIITTFEKTWIFPLIICLVYVGIKSVLAFQKLWQTTFYPTFVLHMIKFWVHSYLCKVFVCVKEILSTFARAVDEIVQQKESLFVSMVVQLSPYPISISVQFTHPVSVSALLYTGDVSLVSRLHTQLCSIY